MAEIEVRSLFYMLTNTSSINHDYFKNEKGAGIDKDKVAKLEDHILNYLTSKDIISVSKSAYCIDKMLGGKTYIFLYPSPRRTAKIYIGLNGITDYETYVCEVPFKELNSDALSHLYPINGIDNLF